MEPYRFELLTTQIMATPKTRRKRSGTIFTSREQEVLKLVITGKTTKEIASHLYINIQTINTHKRRMMKKINSNNISGVICYSLVHGILDIETIRELSSGRKIA